MKVRLATEVVKALPCSILMTGSSMSLLEIDLMIFTANPLNPRRADCQFASVHMARSPARSTATPADLDITTIQTGINTNKHTSIRTTKSVRTTMIMVLSTQQWWTKHVLALIE